MKSASIKAWIGMTLCASLFSFSRIGGEGFTIHLNNKLLLEHHFTSKSVTPSFSLDKNSANGELSIYYNECGQIGKQRSLTLKDDKGLVLKNWRFVNAEKEHTPMAIQVKDILALTQKTSTTLKLYYNSQRVSDGRLLANIIQSDDVKASRK